MTEGYGGTREPTESGHLRISFPQDVGLGESAELVEGLAAEYQSVEIRRTNPNAIVIGGPGIESIVVTVVEYAPYGVLYAALAAFAVRFFQRLGDDAHEAVRRGIVVLSERIRQHRSDRIRQHRGQASGSEGYFPIDWYFTFTMKHSNENLEDAISFEVLVTSQDELDRMVQEAAKIKPKPPEEGKALQSDWVWSASEERWVERLEKYD